MAHKITNATRMEALKRRKDWLDKTAGENGFAREEREALIWALNILGELNAGKQN